MTMLLMQSKKILKITTLVILLTGCSLPMNEAKKQEQVQPADLKTSSEYEQMHYSHRMR